MKAGKLVLDIGTFPSHDDPLYVGQSVLGSIYAMMRDPSDRDYRETQEWSLVQWYELTLQMHEKYLAEGKELNFQVAVTGELAGKGRKPFPRKGPKK
jgi:hypothetical protein